MHDLQFLSEASFWVPNYLAGQSAAWVEHVPFAFWLVDHLRPKVIVELGTHSGLSYFAFCEAVKRLELPARCFAVDTWKGDIHSGIYGTESDEIYNGVLGHNNANYYDFSTLVRATFDQALPQFTDRKIDLLHIDGRHFYEDVKHDYESWAPKLSDRAVVLFHDTRVRVKDFGVHQLWAEVADGYPHFEFIHGHGLGVLGYGRDVPDDIRSLFTADARAAASTRAAYSRLGSALSADMELAHGRNEIAALKLKVAELISATSERVSEIGNKLDLERRKSKAAEDTLQAVLSSRSWKMTEPLRAIKQTAGRLGYRPRTVVELHGRLGNVERGLGEKGLAVLDFQHRNDESLVRHGQKLGSVINSTGRRLTRSLRRVAALLRGPGLPPDFDPQEYRLVNPDVVALGADPTLHYLTFGRAEGRRYRIPELPNDFDGQQDSGRPTCIVVSHDASLTGAPVLGLNLATSLSEKYNVVSFLLGGGKLKGSFENISTFTFCLDNSPGADDALLEIILRKMLKKIDVSFVIVNSIESRRILSIFARLFIPTISLIHEFAANTRPIDAFRFAFLWSTSVVFSTTLTHRDVVEHYPDLRDTKVSILPQGRCDVPMIDRPSSKQSEPSADLGKYVKSHIKPTGKEILILGAGTVHYRKGVDNFVQIAQHVAKRVDCRNCRFVWIGSGYNPETELGYSVYLADQIKRAGLADVLSIIPENPDLEGLFGETDVFVLSSRLDPLPNVAIEFDDSGIPVVCFRKSTGIAQYLDSDKLSKSCVAEYMNLAEAAELVAKFALSAKLRNEIGAECRAVAENVFNWSRYVADLEDIGRDVREQTRREKRDVKTILESGAFDCEYYAASHQEKQTETQSVVTFVRSWSTHVATRKPHAGFHPGVYAEENGLQSTDGDPFAHYIRAGRPKGIWSNRVIELVTSLRSASWRAPEGGTAYSCLLCGNVGRDPRTHHAKSCSAGSLCQRAERKCQDNRVTPPLRISRWQGYNPRHSQSWTRYRTDDHRIRQRPPGRLWICRSCSHQEEPPRGGCENR